MNNIPLLGMMVLSLGLLFYLGCTLLEERRNTTKIKKRIESIIGEGGSTLLQSRSLIRMNKESVLEKKLNAILSANKTGENILQSKLYRCGMTMGIKQIAFYLTLMSICFFICFDLLVGFNWIQSGLAMVFTLVVFSSVVLGFLEKRRGKKILVQLSSAVDIILRGIKSGSSVEKSFYIVAREIAAPLGQEFEQINRELEFGVSFEKVLHKVAARIHIPEFYFFTTALIIQRKSGGSLVDVLENIMNTLSKRREVQLKIKIYSSEAKTSGYVLAFLPLVVWLVLMKVKPEHIEFFYTDPLGKNILCMASGLFFSAFIMIKRLINFDV